MPKLIKRNALILILAVVSVLGFGARSFAQTSSSASTLFVPLIGITSVPTPLALPKGPGSVTYNYAVKNFLREVPLTDIQVTDNNCSPVKFVGGDDNGDNKLDFSETWRYACTIKISETTQSVATAIGTANNLPAAHKAYATVVVGSNNPAPLVDIINITKVSYPLTLPAEGGDITFTYRVNNPGVVPLSDVSVVDDKCAAMSGKLGDTNGNNLLDITEVWVYSCKTHLNTTTTNTVSVAATANGLKAVGYATLTVTVATPNLPNTGTAGGSPSIGDTGSNSALKMTVWIILAVVLAALVASFLLIRKRKLAKTRK
jgi:hypothetical protein